MKKLLLFFIITLLTSCDKDEANETLPPATQTGARTFGCLVNGEVFVHDSNVINCFYQVVEGEYYFGIQGDDTVEMLTGMSLGSDKKQLLEGQTYELKEPIDNNVYAGGIFTQSVSSADYSSTSIQFTGQLTITKLDFTQNIVSGIFWFDLQNPFTGEIVEIRQGRFDTYFTQ